VTKKEDRTLALPRWMPPEGERGFAHTTDTYLLEEGETLEDALESLR
jgi:hypothetical protein